MIQLAHVSRPSSAAPSHYFARWIDHATWSEWDVDTEWVHLQGPVRAGTRGVMKPQGGPKVKFEIFECKPDRVYTDVSRMPGAKLTFRHTVQATDSGSELTIDVQLMGPLAWFWARTALKGLGASATQALDRLIILVEAQHQDSTLNSVSR